MASNSQSGVDAQEAKLLKVQWNCVEELVSMARTHFENANFKTSLELCEKALSIHPNYFPAIELKKTISDTEKSVTAQFPFSSMDLFDPDFDFDGLERYSRTEHAGCTPLRKTFRAQAVHQPTPTASTSRVSSLDNKETHLKSCLKRPTTAPVVESDSDSEQESCSGRTLTLGGKWDGPLLSDRKLKHLLLEGTFFLISCIELYHRLSDLWHPQLGLFQCPHGGCGVPSSKRLKVVRHFLTQHFGESSEGQQVLPFACETCRERFISTELLLSHAAIHHRNCSWADALKEELLLEM